MKTKTIFTQLKRPRTLGALLLAVLIVALLLVVFNTQKQLKHVQQGASVTVGCSSAGSSKNPNGTYHFSPLHVSGGKIVDENNCAVYLRGFNTSGTEFGNGTGDMSAPTIAQFNQTFKMNLWRLSINITWWNQDMNVPKVNMPYRAWIQQIVRWMEANGDYVELNRVNQYMNPSYPPCGGSITYCPAQNAGKGTNPVGNPHWLDETIKFWNTITPLYNNDPAIMYNIWNEMPGVSNAVLWRAAEETLITTVRTIAPNSLIFFGGPAYNNAIQPLTRGKVPDFTEANLVYDFHVYQFNEWWKNWPTLPLSELTFTQQHNHAVDIGEWGGSSNVNPYNDTIINFALQHAVALTYYESHNVFSGGQLNSSGLLVQKGYNSLPSGAAGPTGTTTVSTPSTK